MTALPNAEARITRNAGEGAAGLSNEETRVSKLGFFFLAVQ